MATEPHTVYDIARLAGVSPATVSRVITGTVRVTPEKELRVRQVMEQVNFRPNAFARTLLRKRSYTLGVILPDITNLFFSQTFLALEQVAGARGYTLLLGNTLNSDQYSARDLEAFYLNSLHERQVDGILLMGGRANDTDQVPEKLEELVKINWHKPVVTINGALQGTPIQGVRIDEAAGIGALVEHLVKLGHRRFGLLGGVAGVSSFDLKRSALEKALAKRGIGLPSEWVIPTGFSLSNGAHAVSKLLQLPSRPTALVCINDWVAMGVIREATNLGLAVPRDFSVTGFDDIQTSAYYVPSLTTVSQQYQELAEAAISIILGRIEKIPRPDDTVIEPQLVVRESTAPPFSGQ